MFLSDFTFACRMIGPVIIRWKRPALTALIACILVATTSGPASAQDATPSPSSIQISDAELAKASKSALVATTKLYKAALSNRILTTRAINEAFAKAVKRAKQEQAAALAKASTPAQRSAAASRFKSRIDRAVAIRQAALDSLPQLPPSGRQRAVK